MLDQGLQLRCSDPFEPNEDRGIPVEMRRGEEHARVACQYCLLGVETVGPYPQDRAIRGGVAQLLQVLLAQRALPKEEFFLNAPLFEPS